MSAAHDIAEAGEVLALGWIWHQSAALGVQPETGLIFSAADLRRVFGRAALDAWIAHPSRRVFDSDPASLRRAYLAQRRALAGRLVALQSSCAEAAADRVQRELRRHKRQTGNGQ